MATGLCWFVPQQLVNHSADYWLIAWTLFFLGGGLIIAGVMEEIGDQTPV